VRRPPITRVTHELRLGSEEEDDLGGQFWTPIPSWPQICGGVGISQALRTAVINLEIKLMLHFLCSLP
jgi:hypothetical protein